jgi:hypothetical protein
MRGDISKPRRRGGINFIADRPRVAAHEEMGTVLLFGVEKVTRFRFGGHPAYGNRKLREWGPE